MEGENKQSIAVRILRHAGSGAEKISVLELRAAYAGAQALQIRMEPLAAEERVVSLAYPGNRLRFAAGRFVRYGDSDRVAGAALFEMYDGDDRLVLDHGASGAPVWIARAAWLPLSATSSRKRCNLQFRADTDFDGLGTTQRRIRAHSSAVG